MAAHHDHHHDPSFDPGSLYKEQWVQDLVGQIQSFLRSNRDWLGVDAKTPLRVLDYACGHGTVSGALVLDAPQSTFRGIDIHAAQVERFNATATELLGAAAATQRMVAVEGDLLNPSAALAQAEWFGFDLVIVSMALHHVSDPRRMLGKLKERTKPGGSIVVVEFLSDGFLPQPHHHHQHHHSTEPPPAPAESDGDTRQAHGMVDTPSGQKIWPGFAVEQLQSHLEAVGCADVQVKWHPEMSLVKGPFGEAKVQMIFVKARA